jgi:hypothetical protein
MRARTVLILCSLLYLCLSAVTGAGGATARRLDFSVLAQRAQMVVVARVVASRPFWDPATRTIWTNTELQILEAVKGGGSRSVTVTEPGGIIGNTGHWFPGVPSFAAGEEVVLFLYHSRKRIRVLGLNQGVYTVSVDEATGARVVRPRIHSEAEVFAASGGQKSEADARTETRRPLRTFLQDIRGASNK